MGFGRLHKAVAKNKLRNKSGKRRGTANPSRCSSNHRRHASFLKPGLALALCELRALTGMLYMWKTKDLELAQNLNSNQRAFSPVTILIV